MTGGNSPIGYLKAYSTNLYLSADPSKVREALEEGQRCRLDEGAPPRGPASTSGLTCALLCRSLSPLPPLPFMQA